MADGRARTQFKKGQSGNPGGRGKVPSDLRELARKHCPKALETLVKLIANARTPAAARIAGIKLLFERGYGMPRQTVEVEGGNEAVSIVIRRGAESDDAPKPEGSDT